MFLHHVVLPEATANTEKQLGIGKVRGAIATLVDTSASSSDAAWLQLGDSVALALDLRDACRDLALTDAQLLQSPHLAPPCIA